VEPLVSIIIRSMGRDCLANAVASVVEQTHRPLELLVVDATGGSHPPLPDLPTLTHARLVSVGRRLLRPAAANVGIDHAQGEWIGFLDDDDFLEPTHVARLVARAADPDRPRLVHAQLWGLDRFHRVAIRRDTRVNPLIMYYNCQVAAMSCILHRSLVDTGLRLDESLPTNEDWDFWLKLMPHTHFATVREPTHFYFAEAGTSGTGIGLNSHDHGGHRRHQDVVRQRYAGERDEAWEAHFRRLAEGIALQRDGRLQEAIAFYGQVMCECPDEPNAVYLAAQAHLQAGELHAARVAFRRAIALNMDAADYYVGLGDTSARLGYHDEARDAYASAIKFNPALMQHVAPRMASLPRAVATRASHASAMSAAVVARNAPCPCGSGLRYKQCHGRTASSNTGDAEALEDRALGIRLAAAGANRRARAALSRAIASAPGDVEALHAHGLLSWDAGDLPTACASIERAAALAHEDVQITEALAAIRGAIRGREVAQRARATISTLVGAASGRKHLPLSPDTSVHLVSPFENAHAGTEMHAIEIARILAPVAKVFLWATQPVVPPELAVQGVVRIAAHEGRFPTDGVVVMFGSWQTPPSWIAQARPSRILVVHNVDNAELLLELISGLLERSNVPVDLLMPSEAFRRSTGLPGVAYSSPIDIARFSPRTKDETRNGFVVGRLSRNEHLKYHPDDPDLMRRMIDAGMRVRMMGATVLRRYFPPATAIDGLELLPPGSEDAAAFLRTLDAFFYRTSPSWQEAAGRVVAEAMATGLPCVCARNVGFAELIAHGVDGFLFDADDDDAALAHLRMLRDDVELRRRMGRAARARVEQVFGPGLADAIRSAYLDAPQNVSFPPQ
jgi:tetratricopeptide (TPR) repeat protein